MTGLPPAIGDDVCSFLSERTGRIVTLEKFSPTGGGCINHGGKLSTTAGVFFLKWNLASSFPGMFYAEARGLSLLSEKNIIDIPRVAGHRTIGQFQWILMEFIASTTPATNYWSNLGEQLARLHSCTQVHFGLDHDNYIGSLPQHNTLSGSWVDFFINQRLDVQLRLAVDSGKTENSLVKSFEHLYTLLTEMLPLEKPSLLHGDLWNGNVMVNARGEPCLIDPAMYYGNREAEIAFTYLFGGFDAVFYTAYQTAFPLSPGFDRRRDIYNLYPLLVHVNLFGGGYVDQVKTILKKLVQ